MSNLEDRGVYILSCARTPIGNFAGALKSLNATDLGAIAIKESIKRSGLQASDISEVYMGHVVTAGCGQNSARQAALKAGMPNTTICTTVNKVCASGMKAIILATQQIKLGEADIIIAGGMESMSNGPRLLDRSPPIYGEIKMTDTVVLDGLTDASSGDQMGVLADAVAAELKITRVAQDEFAISSYKRSAAAWDPEKGAPLSKEVVPVEVPAGRGQTVVVKQDEEFTKANFEKLKTLKAVFSKTGTITPGNASTLSDGGAACVLISGAAAKKRGLKPLAKIVSYADAAGDPKDFPIIPAKAMPKALEKAGLSIDDISLFEINEAFSMAALGNIQLCKLDPAKVNVHGGAVSLGHPLGMSGTRIVNTLALQLKPGQYGLAGICNGGGGASSVLVQAL